MNTYNIEHLYRQYLECRLSPTELMELKHLLANEEGLSQFYELIDGDWNKLDQELTAHFPEHGQARIFKTIVNETKVNSTVTKLWKYIATMAAAAILISGIYFMIGKIRYTNEQELYASRITPGTNRATLTLANGKVIALADVASGALLKEAGLTVTKTATGEVIYNASGVQDNKKNASGSTQINQLHTAKGETYVLTLPDQSKVWLNAESSIHFPSKFPEKYRKVKLSGEAYFEIHKDPHHPFLVESGTQTVEVLGTHFNINAYGDEGNIKTTLLEGAVKIIPAVGTPKVLIPDQQAVYNGRSVEVIPADTEMAVDWKNGYFVFKNEDFKTAMRKIERWYDVEIIYDPNLSIDLEPGGWISRKSDIRTILNRIEATSGIHFKLEERRITVTK